MEDASERRAGSWEPCWALHRSFTHEGSPSLLLHDAEGSDGILHVHLVTRVS